MLEQSDFHKALMSQSAVNLTGLAQELAAVTKRLMSQAVDQQLGTEFVNQHPIVRLYVAQMLHLAYGELPNTDNWHEAYTYVKERARDYEALFAA